MKVECSNCGALFEAKGVTALMALSGGTDCPKCNGKDTVNLIVAEIKK